MAMAKEKTFKLSCVILNYQTDDLVLQLLKKITSPELDIIVVDNSPIASLKDKLKNVKNVRYFFAGRNMGFSGGVNFGIKRAYGEWVLLLNSDVDTTIEQINDFFGYREKYSEEVFVPKLIYPDGKIQKNVGLFPKMKSLHNWLFLRPKFITSDTTRLVHFATGAVILIKKNVFNKIGFFDEKRFFMYFEDIDFGYRLYKRNIPIRFIPEIVMTHIEGASSDKNKKQKKLNYKKGVNQYLDKHRGGFIMNMNRVFRFLR